MTVEITFLGAAGTVTGSRFLLRAGERHFLLDCGLFQGRRKVKSMNREPLPFSPEKINAILLSHAHIDHTGYLPRLVSQGYRGPVFTSEATCALLEILLPDSAYLQEQDAVYANKRGYSRHHPALPLYTVEDAEQAIKQLRPIPFHQQLELEGLAATWKPSGHILGAGILELETRANAADRRVVFSGDLGRFSSAIMKPPVKIPEADILLVESTYGDRLHADESLEDLLSGILNQISQTGGVLLIPAFAVGRTQQILFHLRRIQDKGQAPDLPVFIDSPMAVDTSHIYCRYGDDHNLDQNLLMDDRQCPLRCRETHFVREVDDSKELNIRPGPAVIISASGMCTGGRILHHLKWRLPDRRNAVLFVGYQAQGSRGRMLLEGAEHIRIHGQQIPVQAQILQIDGLSAHADREELTRWLREFDRRPRRTFIIHGEDTARRSLQEHLDQSLGWPAYLPRQGETVPI